MLESVQMYGKAHLCVPHLTCCGRISDSINILHLCV